MEQLLQWVKKLAVFMILSAYMEHLLPASYRRYFHMCTGLILILMIGTPLMQVVDGSIGVDFEFLQEDLKIGSSVYHFDGESAAAFQTYYMDQYKNAVEKQICQLAESAGLQIRRITLEVDEDMDSENYGQVLGTEIVLETTDGLTDNIRTFRESLSGQLGIERSKIEIHDE